METYNIMKAQAGSRIIRAMSNGSMVLTTHYRDDEAFLQALAEKNAYALQWEEAAWKAI